MSNIYDNAYGLEKAIRESEEFKSLKSAYDEVMKDPESKRMFETFRDTQLSLQDKQMQGLDITESEVEEARSIVETVQENPVISKLMEEEQRLNMIISEISSIITKPLEEVYGFEQE